MPVDSTDVERVENVEDLGTVLTERVRQQLRCQLIEPNTLTISYIIIAHFLRKKCIHNNKISLI